MTQHHSMSGAAGMPCPDNQGNRDEQTHHFVRRPLSGGNPGQGELGESGALVEGLRVSVEVEEWMAVAGGASCSSLNT